MPCAPTARPRSSNRVDYVIRRREAHIAALYRMAALLSLSGDLVGSGAASFRAVAESRALAEFMAASPAYCLDCFLLGGRCERHQRGDERPFGGSVRRAAPNRHRRSAPTGSARLGLDRLELGGSGPVELGLGQLGLGLDQLGIGWLGLGPATRARPAAPTRATGTASNRTSTGMAPIRHRRVPISRRLMDRGREWRIGQAKHEGASPGRVLHFLASAADAAVGAGDTRGLVTPRS